MAEPDASPSRSAGAWRLVPAVAAALATVWFAGFLGPVAQGEIPTLVLPWLPRLGIAFAFRLDGLALAFALLICGIGALILLYAATYFRTDRRLGALLAILTTFAVAMLGLVTADELQYYDLSRCHLAVLSSCESALGAWSNGQGLASLQQALDQWRDESVDTFLTSYRTALTDSRLWPANSEDADKVLQFFVLEKAFYEIEYELAHRPEWLRVALSGALRALGDEQP